MPTWLQDNPTSDVDKLLQDITKKSSRTDSEQKEIDKFEHIQALRDNKEQEERIDPFA